MKLLRSTLLCLYCVLFALTVGAQDTCTTRIQNALTSTRDNCDNVVPNTICYGHGTLTGDFNTDTSFTVSGDRLDLSAVESIQLTGLNDNQSEWGIISASIDVANLPVTLLAFGDVSIQNMSALPTLSATVSASSTVNLRGGPGTTHPVIITLEPDTPIILNGRTETGDWLRVQLPDASQSAWIADFLVQTEAMVDNLAVVEAEDVAFAPMQNMLLQTESQNASCDDAPPNGLLLQSTLEDAAAELFINDIHLFLNGTAFIQHDDLFTIHVLDGEVTIEAQDTSLPVPAGARGNVTVDNIETPITLEPYSATSLQTLPLALLPHPVEFPAPLTDDDVQAILENQRRCRVFSSDIVNIRVGPGIVYPADMTLEANIRYFVDAQADGLDGQVWLLLANGGWVRADVINTEGDCQQLNVVTSIPPTPTPVPTSAPITRYQSFGFFGCQHYGYEDLRAGDVITFMLGPHVNGQSREELEGMLGSSTGFLSVDGAAQAPAQPVGIQHEQQGFIASQRFVWIATPGTHTITGGWTNFWQESCVLAVEE